MSYKIMFNPLNQEMYDVADTDTDRLNRLADSGFRQVEKYDLVAVYNPNLNAHRTVLRTDVQTWVNQGYYAEPTWVYHPEQPAKVVSADEAKYLRDNGWYDSPAKFPRDAKAAIVEKAVKAMKDDKDGGKKPAAAA